MRRGWENGGSLDAPLPRPGLPGYND
jgi:hypothetical protein